MEEKPEVKKPKMVIHPKSNLMVLSEGNVRQLAICPKTDPRKFSSAEALMASWHGVIAAKAAPRLEN